MVTATPKCSTSARDLLATEELGGRAGSGLRVVVREEHVGIVAGVRRRRIGELVHRRVQVGKRHAQGQIGFEQVKPQMDGTKAASIETRDDR